MLLPMLVRKDYAVPWVFTAANLLRDAWGELRQAPSARPS
jgi:hypothetical protein